MIDYGQAATDVCADEPLPSLLTQISKAGFARVRLDREQAGHLDSLYRETMHFSRRDAAQKALHQTQRLSSGYRPLGAAHAGDPDTADFNDSFLYWTEQTVDSIPEADRIQPLLTALEKYRRVCAQIITRLIRELCDYYGRSEEALPFEATSVLQFNSFHIPTDRPILQTMHEDGVVATVIWASAPGLEVIRDGVEMPLTPNFDEVFVMPGSILAAMTGGAIPPLFHQVRNARLTTPPGQWDEERKSIMYFSTFDPSGNVIEPFVRNDYNRETDIAELIIRSPDMFGIPEGFYRSNK